MFITLKLIKQILFLKIYTNKKKQIAVLKNKQQNKPNSLHINNFFIASCNTFY